MDQVNLISIAPFLKNLKFSAVLDVIRGGRMEKKPSIEVVLDYARGNVRKIIAKTALHLPQEHRDEMESNAYLRVIQVYDKIDAEKGWKSFVFRHCKGAVLDYLKSGNGFSEGRWSLQTKDDDEILKSSNKRVDYVSQDSQEADLDHVLGFNGVFGSDDLDKIKINWDLVARMASRDQGIYFMALWIRGNTLETIGEKFELTPQRIWAIIQEFINRFDDPKLCQDPWLLQTIYAFGLCDSLGVHNVDQVTVFGFPIGWDLEPISLEDLSKVNLDEINQLTFDIN